MHASGGRRRFAPVVIGAVLALLLPLAGAGADVGAGAAAGAAARAAVPVPPGTPPASGAVCYYGACYQYVYGYQVVSATGASVLLYQAMPELDPNDPDGHSLQELAVESANGRQIVEVGWTVDRGLNGDARPHLFTFHWVKGHPTCYNTCGFVSTSATVKPGDAVTPDVGGQFGIAYSNGAWQVSYDDQVIGYYPGSLWHGRFTRLGLVQAFGEVAASGTSSCTDMGDGLRAEDPHSSWVSGFRLVGASARAQLSVAKSTPRLYDKHFVRATSYHLGGPGTGPCPPATVGNPATG